MLIDFNLFKYKQNVLIFTVMIFLVCFYDFISKDVSKDIAEKDIADPEIELLIQYEDFLDLPIKKTNFDHNIEDNDLNCFIASYHNQHISADQLEYYGIKKKNQKEIIEITQTDKTYENEYEKCISKEMSNSKKIQQSKDEIKHHCIKQSLTVCMMKSFDLRQQNEQEEKIIDQTNMKDESILKDESIVKDHDPKNHDPKNIDGCELNCVMASYHNQHIAEDQLGSYGIQKHNQNEKPDFISQVDKTYKDEYEKCISKEMSKKQEIRQSKDEMIDRCIKQSLAVCRMKLCALTKQEEQEEKIDLGQTNMKDISKNKMMNTKTNQDTFSKANQFAHQAIQMLINHTKFTIKEEKKIPPPLVSSTNQDLGVANKPMLLRNEINQIIDQNKQKIKTCMHQDPSLISIQTMLLKIAQNGLVISAQASSIILKKSPAKSCIETVVKTFVFPKFTGKMMEYLVVIPFDRFKVK